jgi:hypothetical protein
VVPQADIHQAAGNRRAAGNHHQAAEAADSHLVAVLDSRRAAEAADSYPVEVAVDSRPVEAVVDSHPVEAVAGNHPAVAADWSPAAGAADQSLTLPVIGGYCCGGSGCGLSADCSIGTHTVDMILSAMVCRLASHSGNRKPM